MAAHLVYLNNEDGLSVKYRHVVRYVYRQNVSMLNMMHNPQGTVIKHWCDLTHTFFTHYSNALNLRGIQVIVHICAIFYLGRIEYRDDLGLLHRLHHVTNDEIRTYWLTNARRQLGTHVFVTRQGEIESIQINLIQYQYGWSSHATINATYPIIRVEPGTVLVLTLGLFYRDFRNHMTNDYGGIAANYRATGNRQYSRDRQFNPLVAPWQCGGVIEIVEQHFVNNITVRVPLRMQQNYSYCAFYVCAGAKLVTVDQYNPTITCMNHNRSLVQPGGLVIVEGCRFQLSVGLAGRGCYNLQTAQTLGILTGGPPIPAIGFENPVIFLGPNDSEYQSIAWDLSIRRNPMNISHRNCYLTIPEGGRIMAIEPWDAGMAEVRARQLYERLHESAISVPLPDQLMANGFEVPDEQMLNRILGIVEANGQQRHYDCHIHAGSQLADVRNAYQNIRGNPDPLPRQFNTYRCSQIFYNQVQHHATSGWVPPMFPPFHQTQLRLKFQSYPSKYTSNLGLTQIRNKMHKIVGPYYVGKEGQNILKYVLAAEKMIPQIQMKRMAFDTRAENINGLTCRLGIDGWFYEPDPNIPENQYLFHTVPYKRTN